MKRLLCLILCALTAFLIPAVSLADTELEDVYCAQANFSTRYDPDYTTEWRDGQGLYIWLDDPGYVPNVLIWRRATEKKLNDPANYLNNVYREYMEGLYGDSVTCEPCRKLSAAGKTVYLARYHYTSKGNQLCMTRVIETRSDGDVEYAAKYPEGEPDEALAALETALKYYQPAGSAPANDKTEEKTNRPDTAKTDVSGTVRYEDGRFYMDLPIGWKILTQSDYASFCLKAWDPADPDRTIFLFMKMEPFLKSLEEKEWYLKNAGSDPSSVYRIYAEAPVMETCTLEAFLNTMPDLISYCDIFYSMGISVDPEVIPRMKDVRIITKTKSSLLAPADCADNSVARIAYKDFQGQKCEGLVTAQPRNPAETGIPGIDAFMTYTVNLFMGVTAPEGELDPLRGTLTGCLASFGFTDEYVRKAVGFSKEQTKELKQQLEQIEAVQSAFVEAWTAR